MLKRNDKCYCGSGKKYKNCCMGKDKLEKVEMLNEQARDNKKEKIDKKYAETIIKVSGYVEELILKDEKFVQGYENARKSFFDENVKENPISNRFFGTFFLYDFLMEKDITPALYVANKKRFTTDEKIVIQNCVNSYPSMFEIDQKNGKEIIIKDVFSERRYNTLDSRILGEFNEGDYIIARPVLLGDTFALIDLTVRIQKETKDIVYKSLMDGYELSKKANPRLNIEYFIMLNTMFFYKYMLQLLQSSDKTEEVEALEKAEEVEEVEPASEMQETKNFEENKEEVVEETKEVEEVVLDDKVANLISANISDKEALAKALNIWKMVLAKKEITGSENGWAAGLEYNYRKSQGETVTQAEVAKSYGVSASTLAKRNKEIAALV